MHLKVQAAQVGLQGKRPYRFPMQKSPAWPEAEQSFGGIHKVLSFSIFCLSLAMFPLKPAPGFGS